MESGKLLAQVWEQISTECMCMGACTYQQLEVNILAQVFDASSLPGMQHAVSEKLVDMRHAQLISKYETMAQHAYTKAVALEHLDRMFSVQHSETTAWINVMPTKDSWEMMMPQ